MKSKRIFYSRGSFIGFARKKMKAAKILSDNRSRKLLALVLSIVILPLLVVSAFYASLAVVPTYSPLFHLNFTFPANFNPLQSNNRDKYKLK